MKNLKNRRNEGFSYYFCLIIEGSGAGSVARTNRFGAGMPKVIRIRIPNTGCKTFLSLIQEPTRRRPWRACGSGSVKISTWSWWPAQSGTFIPKRLVTSCSSQLQKYIEEKYAFLLKITLCFSVSQQVLFQDLNTFSQYFKRYGIL